MHDTTNSVEKTSRQKNGFSYHDRKRRFLKHQAEYSTLTGGQCPAVVLSFFEFHGSLKGFEEPVRTTKTAIMLECGISIHAVTHALKVLIKLGFIVNTGLKLYRVNDQAISLAAIPVVAKMRERDERRKKCWHRRGPRGPYKTRRPRQIGGPAAPTQARPSTSAPTNRGAEQDLPARKPPAIAPAIDREAEENVRQQLQAEIRQVRIYADGTPVPPRDIKSVPNTVLQEARARQVTPQHLSQVIHQVFRRFERWRPVNGGYIVKSIRRGLGNRPTPEAYRPAYFDQWKPPGK